MVALCSKTYLGYSLAAEREERENLATQTRLNEALEHEDHEGDDVFHLHNPDNDEEIVEPPPLPLVPQPLEAHKMSCKGLQKKPNKDRLTFDAYVDVLRHKRSGEGVNKWFATDDSTTYSYQETRQGLSYLYAKRFVLDDGVSSVPLARF